ncbi:MAG: hypothetical protein VXZ96_11815 [Myxococcota bacterium]|nr:hypothetical protein [Myxococcota bacterium]
MDVWIAVVTVCTGFKEAWFNFAQFNDLSSAVPIAIIVSVKSLQIGRINVRVLGVGLSITIVIYAVAYLCRIDVNIGIRVVAVITAKVTNSLVVLVFVVASKWKKHQ